MLANDRHQPGLDRGPRFLPRHLDELAITLHDGLSKAVGIVMELNQGGAFRADESLREHVFTVATNSGCLPVGQRDFQPTRCLAQRTGPVRRAHIISHVVLLGRSPHKVWHERSCATHRHRPLGLAGRDKEEGRAVAFGPPVRRQVNLFLTRPPLDEVAPRQHPQSPPSERTTQTRSQGRPHACP